MGLLNRNISVMLNFTKHPLAPGITTEKNMASSEEHKLLAGNILILMKQTLIWFNLQKDGAEN